MILRVKFCALLALSSGIKICLLVYISIKSRWLKEYSLQPKITLILFSLNVLPTLEKQVLIYQYLFINPRGCIPQDVRRQMKKKTYYVVSFYQVLLFVAEIVLRNTKEEEVEGVVTDLLLQLNIGYLSINYFFQGKRKTEFI